MTVGTTNTQFTPSTTITLYKGVPIDAVNNTFWGAFSTKDEQKNFFDNNFEHKTFTEFTYQRRDGVVNIEANYDDIRAYNYMIYDNYTSGKKSRKVYAFINSIGYVSDFVSSIDFETDVIQTYRFEIAENFQDSYKAFEHCALWYKSGGVSYPCINTQPEGLEVGTEMVANKTTSLLDSTEEKICYCVLCMTATLTGQDTTANFTGGVPTQYVYYIVPFNTSNGAGFFTGSPMSATLNNGTTVELTTIQTLYNAIRQESELVNKCVSITVSQSMPKAVNNGETGVKFNTDDYKHETHTAGGQTFNVIRFGGGRLANVWADLDQSKWEKSKSFGIFDLFPRYEETKLLCYPYSYFEVTDNNGTIKAYKNELFDSNRVQFICLSSLDSSQVEYIPLNYKIDTDRNFIAGDVDAFVSGYEMSLPVISDYTAALMQSSQNSMNASVSNTIRSNETSLAIASATGSSLSQITQVQNNLASKTTANNNALASTLTSLGNSSAIATTGINAAGNLMNTAFTTGSVTATASSAISGATAIGSTLVQNNYNTQMTNERNATNLANTNAANRANTATTNIQNKLRDLSTRYQANTNIQNALNSYNAQIHDAKATADTIVSGGSNVSRVFNFGLSNPIIIAYTLMPEYLDIIANQFKVRGYASNKFGKPHLHTRQRWNYIQTVNANIKADGIEAQDLEKIKTAFNNGITLWHSADVFNYSNSNPEIIDISYAQQNGQYKTGAPVI